MFFAFGVLTVSGLAALAVGLVVASRRHRVLERELSVVRSALYEAHTSHADEVGRLSRIHVAVREGERESVAMFLERMYLHDYAKLVRQGFHLRRSQPSAD